MKIKRITKDDYEDCFFVHNKALREGFVRSFDEGILNFVPNKFLDEFEKNYKNYFQELLDDKNFQTCLCFENKKPIGIIIFGKFDRKGAKEDEAMIDSIYFLREYHNKGYAQKTLEFAENELKENGYKKIFLWCSKENPRAWRFYEKNNYVPNEKKKWNDILDGKTFHNILFEKSI